jgi:hypothetical protein
MILFSPIYIFSQIRHGFRSRIFFELKIPFLSEFDAPYRLQIAPTQSVWSTMNLLPTVFDDLRHNLPTGYDALRRNLLSPWQHQPSPLFPHPGKEDTLTSFNFYWDTFPSWKGIKGSVIVTKAQALLIRKHILQQPISPNHNYT